MLIAEIGQNHNGDMGLARELIFAAKESGADVAKFQVFDAPKLFAREGNPWYGYNLSTELSRSQVEMLAATCHDAHIEFMASAFDEIRVRWLEEVGVFRHKIASRSINDSQLLAAVGATNKELIVSLGMWSGIEPPVMPTDAEVHFLHCVSKYPTQLNEVGFTAVDFGTISGFSDHTIGCTAAITAIARGARIIEKHFTLNKKAYGPDHAGSATPDELSLIATFMKEMRECL
jgi:sialic acid synthase SpsE